ncbi:MAG: CpsB/CapC family capsule biosynthesis tyrosine phosphatase [Bacteroidota bacterium]
MFGWSGIKKKNASLQVDIHSHLIPGIDDGARTLEDTINIILRYKEIGYTKAITTPHIHPSYPNDPAMILDGLLAVQGELKRRAIDFELEAAAEYYVDEAFMEKVRANQTILSFGDRYVLVESSFINKPIYFENCLFELKSKGYQPILAHPERYKFLEGEIDWLVSLKEMDVLFQVTISSFAGFYGKVPKDIAKKLYKEEYIDFLGSDMHHESHLKYMEKGLGTKEVGRLINSSHLMNKRLL